MNDITTNHSGPLDRVATAASGLAALALAGMVVVQGWQVFARYALNASPSWTEPVTLLLLSVTLSFGAAAGVHMRSHFSFPLLVRLQPEGTQRALARFTALIVIGIGGLLAAGGGFLVVDGWPVKLAGAPLPQGVMFLPLAAGGALMVLFALPQFLRPRLDPN